MLTSLTPYRTFRAIHTLAPAVALLALSVTPSSLVAQRVNLSSRVVTASTAENIADAGQLPGSQPINVTLRLTQPADRSAALDQLLSAQTTPASPSYHQWLTPQQYAASYGATDGQIATLTTWAQSQGLAVTTVSAGKTRLILTGTVDQVQRTFATTIHSYVTPGTSSAQPHFAASTTPSLPAEIAPLVASISGLDNLAPAISAKLISTSATGRVAQLSNSDADPLSTTADAIDANSSAILTFDTTACSGDLSPSDIAAYQALFRQASAQGITIVGSNSCPTTDAAATPNALFNLPEITALAINPTAPSDSALPEQRPGWQTAPGLPDDALRHQPDLTVTSTSAFAQALTTITQQTGERQGNINAKLYSLASTPDVYTQPDVASSTPDTWEPTTGLGVVNLQAMIQAFPRAGSFSTTTSLTANSFALNYGDPLTLTAKVLAPVYTTANPTGSVTFTASGQSLGSGTIDSSGTVIFKLPAPLNVGTYNIIATYGGDTNYTSSASNPPIIVTVSIVNATITATVSPNTSAPYGSTATVTATVSLPGSNGAPSGQVTAVVESVTGSTATATLTPNPGGNTATANIPIAIPPPGTYTIEVTCTGNTNFQCQSPVDITNFKTVKGGTIVNVTTVPAAPQAGQPVTITGTVSAAGNGPGPYNFTGTMTFYDNGKVLATGAVSSNQTTTSVTLSGNITHNIVAQYSGDTNWNAGTSAPQAVNPTLLPSTISMNSNLSTALYGTNVVLTATIFTTIANTVGPTGTVSFYDTYNSSIVQLGTVALTPNGPNQSIARFTTTGLLDGIHSIYSIYSGDANFAPATSTTMQINITDYNVVMNPQSLTLKAGQTGQVVVLIGSVGGFSGTVSFGCTPPASSETTCSFKQTILQGGGATTMTINTTAAKAKPAPVQQSGSHKPGSPWSVGTLGGGPALAVLLCFVLPRRRRALPLLLSSLLAVLLIPGMGCSMGTTTTAAAPTAPTDPGTPLGTQTFTITTAGNDGVNTTRHNYQYQVTIQ